ncbi:MAG: putative lipoprotein with Yx(FWY)xxD motif [Oceanospirillaceae bacterium]|jgi:predicted lipoprotein with Yx(FWY)xxD motif
MSQLKKIAIPFVAVLSLIAAGSAHSGNDYSNQTLPAQLSVVKISAGEVLANSKGLTVYTFDKDKQGVSECYGTCASKWPPVLAVSSFSKGKFSTSQRTDGSNQVRHNNKPLYLWVGDKNPGETNGDNIKNLWHIINL